VGIVEAGHDALAGEFDDFGSRADELQNVGGGANSDNSISENGERFGFGLLRIFGPDFAVNEDRIGEDLGIEGRRKCDAKRERQAERGAHEFVNYYALGGWRPKG
jgi:hypothetical protein